MHCGLLGKKLSHSYSPQIHREFADYVYDLFELADADAVEKFLASTDCVGLNVTIPYKETVLPFCRELSAAAQRIGAVNTLKKTSAGWFGDNTDYAGLLALLKFHAVDPRRKSAVILGSGGAAKMAKAVLTDLGADEVEIVSRGGELNYQNVYEREKTAIVINATPVGMYPHSDASPLDLARFPHLTAAVDLIYNPARTQFLAQAEAIGATAAGGMLMLVAQAARAAEIFTGETISENLIYSTFEKISWRAKNIALIGMPGCGKSTLGQKLAERFEREFIDLDARIVEQVGQTIPEIFAARGEKFFRDCESEVLADVAKLSGKIIATGGGVILRAENRERLRRNSCVVYIETPKEKLADLPTVGRPLSSGDDPAQKILALFAERDPLYRQTADIIVERDAAEQKLKVKNYNICGLPAVGRDNGDE